MENTVTATPPKMAFTLRAGVETDHAFIFSTLLRCFKHSSGFAKRIPERTFFTHHHQAIEKLLARATTRVLVVCDPTEANVIWGYAIGEPGIIHFVYVKKVFRRMGIAGALLADVDVNACVFTHWTDGWNDLLRRWPHAQYNPYLL